MGAVVGEVVCIVLGGVRVGMSTGETAPTDLDLPLGDLGGSVSRGAGELTKLPKSLVC